MPKYIDTFLGRRRARLHRLLPVTNTEGAEAEGPIRSTVSGTIVDNSAAALAGVAVALNTDEFTATSVITTGAWSMASVPGGTYTITYTLADYDTITDTITVAGKDLAVGEVEMDSLWSIGGVVTDSDAAFLEVDVELWDNNQGTGSALETKASNFVGDGTVTFDTEVLDGTY